MALVKGTNSYGTVAEADSYFADRIDVIAWTSGSELQKPQALVTATSILDEKIWAGTAVSELQLLAFPRVGGYYDPKLGINVTFSSTVPNRIIVATFELAHHLLNNDGLLDDVGDVIDLSIGPIKLSKVQKPSVVPLNILNIIKPLLANSGANNWFRAN